MANSKFGKRENIPRASNLSLAKTSVKWVPTKSSKSSQSSTSFFQGKIHHVSNWRDSFNSQRIGQSIQNYLSILKAFVY